MPNLPASVGENRRGAAGSGVLRPVSWLSTTRLWRDDRGVMATEFTVIVPFFILLIVLFADVSVLYLTHTEMNNAAREISRRMATGQLQSQSEVQAYAASKLFLGRREYFVDADFHGDKRVTIAIDLHDAAYFGLFFSPLLGRELVAIASAGSEPEAA